MAKRTSDLNTGDVEALEALPVGHPWRDVAGTWTPSGLSRKAWEPARPLAVHILAAYARAFGEPPAHAQNHRSVLAHHLSWLAADNPDLLNVTDALSEVEVARYLATAGAMRRRSHRSRVAAQSTLRSFRRAFPKLFGTAPARGVGDGPTLPAVEDWAFEAAVAQCEGFRSSLTRFHTAAVLHLCRGAGLDGGDVRWVTGGDIVHRPGAGLWVSVNRPGHERQVPVLARYAAPVEAMAAERADRCLIANVTPPAQGEAPGQLCEMVNRSLRRATSEATVSPGRLRKAWLVEHIAAQVPLRSLLQAAGLTTLRSIEPLVLAHAPEPPEALSAFAAQLGGVRRGGRR